MLFLLKFALFAVFTGMLQGISQENWQRHETALLAGYFTVAGGIFLL